MIGMGDLMNTIRKKKKIHIKWKNILIALLILFLLWNLPKVFIKKEEKKVEKKENQVTEKQKEFEKIGKEIDYYNKDYLDRYLAYQLNNKELEETQIIKDVNMNLDQIPYEYRLPSKNTNTEKVLVNKYYYLDENYVPDNLETIDTKYASSNMRLVKPAKEAFESLSKKAKEENLQIIAMSTYRSYQYQVNLYNRYAKEDGVEKADTYSGRPGHSEHQTGLAVDVYNKKENYTNFGKTKEYEWMQQHAHEYGFILRFQEGKEKETGYEVEEWHYRYVGVEIATYIKEHNITLEEYYATKIKDW